MRIEPEVSDEAEQLGRREDRQNAVGKGGYGVGHPLADAAADKITVKQWL